MKALLIALLVSAVLAGKTTWNLPDSLPSCYTTLPFNFTLTPGYTYKSTDLPSWASIDQKQGLLIGQSDKAGAWPFSLSVGDSKGNSIDKQYIINVIDHNSAANDLWANSTDSYYSRKVDNPFRIVANLAASTIVNVGDKFSYNFKTENQVGSPVFAFLNLP